MNGVLLDSSGAPARRQQPQLLLPDHVMAELGEPEVFGYCTVCSAKRKREGLPPLKFYKGEEKAWQEHCGRCARENFDELMANAPSQRNKGTFFDINERDRELESHFRRVGERMRAERRWDVKPHERAEVE